MIIFIFIMCISLIYFTYQIGNINGWKRGFEECDKLTDRTIKEEIEKYLKKGKNENK